MSRFVNKNMIEAAKRYAEADRTDPFAYSRAMSHLANGVADYALKSGQGAYYDAKEETEMRQIQSVVTGKLESYPVTVYHNIVRP